MKYFPKSRESQPGMSLPCGFGNNNMPVGLQIIGRWFDEAEAEAVMTRLRSFSHDGKPVFQSYHAEVDPDCWRFLPSGSVGIPPVAAAYHYVTGPRLP